MERFSRRNVSLMQPAIPITAPVATTSSPIYGTRFTANWGAIKGATAYKIYVSTVQPYGTEGSVAVTGFSGLIVATNSVSVTGLTPNTTYYYKVLAFNSIRTTSLSNTITTLTETADPVATDADSITDNGFTANWEAVTGATSYKLDVSTSATFATFVAGFEDLTVSGAILKAVTGLTPDTTYYYRVRAVNASGTSDDSNVIETDTTITDAPVATASDTVLTTSFNANWEAVAGATSYKLDVSESATFETFVAGFEDLTVEGAVTQAVTGLTLGTLYYSRVRAVSATGTSVSSNVIETTTASE